MRGLRLVLLAAAGLVLLIACSGGDSEPTGDGAASDTADPAPFSARAVTLEREDADPVELCLLVADTPALRARGLSERESVEPWDGMLFEFEEAQQHGFWIRDTLVPLDLVPLRPDGTLGAAIPMNTCPSGDCPTYRPDLAYDRAIELPQGELAKRDIEPGAATVTASEGDACSASR